MREEPVVAAPPATDDSTSKSLSTTTGDNDGKEQNGGDSKSSDQEFIFIHDTGFTVKIVPPGVEPFEIQVRVHIFLSVLIDDTWDTRDP